jgi:hypothetical protein
LPPPLPGTKSTVLSTSVAQIDLSTFSASSAAADQAALLGVDPSTVTVTVTDLPVASTLTLAGLSSLSAAASDAMAASLLASLPATVQATANVSISSSPAAAGRRLLDMSASLLITGVGSSTADAAAVSATVTSPSALGAVAAAGGASGVTASTPVVSARLTVTVVSLSLAPPLPALVPPLPLGSSLPPPPRPTPPPLPPPPPVTVTDAPPAALTPPPQSSSALVAAAVLGAIAGAGLLVTSVAIWWRGRGGAAAATKKKPTKGASSSPRALERGPPSSPSSLLKTVSDITSAAKPGTRFASLAAVIRGALGTEEEARAVETLPANKPNSRLAGLKGVMRDAVGDAPTSVPEDEEAEEVAPFKQRRRRQAPAALPAEVETSAGSEGDMPRLPVVRTQPSRATGPPSASSVESALESAERFAEIDRLQKKLKAAKRQVSKSAGTESHAHWLAVQSRLERKLNKRIARDPELPFSPDGECTPHGASLPF